MKDSYKRISILIISFMGALLLIIGLGKFIPGYSLFEFLKGKPVASEEKVNLARTSAMEASEVPISTKLSQEYAAVSRAVMPSIVSIDTARTQATKQTDKLGRTSVIPKNVTGQGSGVIVSEEGHIITNHHVIANKGQIMVTLYNGARFEAILIGYDPSLDIAVLKIEYTMRLMPLKFGNSDKVREGHLVMAFGNPYGIGRSITNGIISARKSSRSDLQTSLFQTNVAINPGNSGGPLVNVVGEIVGINSSIYSTDKENPGFQGISFAIPSNLVKKTFLDILEFKRPMRGYLGLYAENLAMPSMRNKSDYPGRVGVIIREVEKNSPAEKAGLQKLDVILSYDGKAIEDKQDLMQHIQATRVGKEIMIDIWRNDSLEKVAVKLVEIDVGVAYLKQKQFSQEVNRSILRAVGISATSLGPNYGINGVRVTNVLKGSLTENKIQKGDIIYKINQNPIYHAAHLRQMILALTQMGKTRFYVIRDGQELASPIEIPQVNES